MLSAENNRKPVIFVISLSRQVHPGWTFKGGFSLVPFLNSYSPFLIPLILLLFPPTFTLLHTYLQGSSFQVCSRSVGSTVSPKASELLKGPFDLSGHIFSKRVSAGSKSSPRQRKFPPTPKIFIMKIPNIKVKELLISTYIPTTSIVQLLILSYFALSLYTSIHPFINQSILFLIHFKVSCKCNTSPLNMSACISSTKLCLGFLCVVKHFSPFTLIKISSTLLACLVFF